jgi:hypothetical protein
MLMLQLLLHQSLLHSLQLMRHTILHMLLCLLEHFPLGSQHFFEILSVAFFSTLFRLGLDYGLFITRTYNGFDVGLGTS